MASSNSMTPAVGTKRTIPADNSEVLGLRIAEERMALLILNKGFTDFKYNIQFNRNFEIPNEKRIEKSHEYMLMELLTDADAKALLLYMLTNASGENLCREHGIQLNGQIRGASTMIVIDLTIWKRFFEAEIRPIFQERHNTKMRKLSAKKDPIIKEDIEDKEYSQVLLERNFKKMQKALVPHIIAQYGLKKGYQDKIVELNSALDNDKLTIKSLEEALSREQKKVLDTERRVAGQKGAGTRCLYIFFSYELITYYYMINLCLAYSYRLIYILLNAC
jgi:hypothetical protein